MSREFVLSCQILIYMLMLVLMIIVIVILGFWLFYSFVFDYFLGGVVVGNDENMMMWDWVWIVMVFVISVMIFFFLIVKLLLCIFMLLNVVVISLKCILQGELDVRVWCVSFWFGEINYFVNDFNEMVEKLQMLDS